MVERLATLDSHRVSFALMRKLIGVSVLLVLGCYAFAMQDVYCELAALSPRDRAAKNFERATVVFEGTVVSKSIVNKSAISTSTDGGKSFSIQLPETRYLFRADRVYKGPALSTFTVYGSPGFQIGKQYLVYAFGEPDALKIPLHDFTGLSVHAAPELRSLRGEAPTPKDLLRPSQPMSLTPDSGGVVCGHVRRGSGEPAARASVTLWDADEKTYVKRVDADTGGHFVIPLVEPGSYLVSAMTNFGAGDQVPPEIGFYGGGITFADAAPLELKAGDASCVTDIDLRTQPGFTVAGSIHVAGSDVLTDEVTVKLANIASDEPFGIDRRAHTRDRFTFHGVPPRRYIVQGLIPLRWSSEESELDVQGDRFVKITMEKGDRRFHIQWGGCPTPKSTTSTPK